MRIRSAADTKLCRILVGATITKSAIKTVSETCSRLDKAGLIIGPGHARPSNKVD